MSSDYPQTAKPEPADRSVRILIVDDRYENRYFLETLLRGNGYEVVSAKTGQEALEKLKSEAIDAIITDILMPVLDGHMLCQMVRKDPKFTHIPFIFFTASYTEPRHRDYGLSLGADEYISKPIEPDDLMVIIRKVIQKVQQGDKAAWGKIPLE